MLIHLSPHHNITQTIQHTPHILWPHSKHTQTTELMSGLAWCPPLGSCPQPWHLPPIEGRDQSISIFLHFSSGPCTKSLPVIAWTRTPPTVTTVTVPPPSRSQTPLPCFWQEPSSLPLLRLLAQTSPSGRPHLGIGVPHTPPQALASGMVGDLNWARGLRSCLSGASTFFSVKWANTESTLQNLSSVTVDIVSTATGVLLG
ncbi:PREDICTED: LOW QUALITY PROTEIN: uncharacterized protein LOC108512845 [Rhinopithecus bieti]|uniref:LOW QUALITY PROTEIN: uncharacterized protein LOC108512845 n=1 Tax=Rhinopithecus bieti TaxID=61621 RepID=UPI00083C3AE1|nr:PREDICTED: LOW QUALITY PROTEIN: uncharacterized protein LOC108512845 [Rhinopithecus bieti]